MNIAVVGACGKLGSLVVQTLSKMNHKVIKIDKKLSTSLYDYSNLDGVIDVSCAEFSIQSAKYCNKNNVALLVGCTGHTNQQKLLIDKICTNIAYCICPNFSIGVQFVLQTLNHLHILNNPNIQIVETHHKHKLDSPSGTAIAIKQKIESQTNITPTITSIRKGEVIGKHFITISMPFEKITICHSVNNRKVFAVGAALAINKLLTQPAKKYTFLELLENKHEH